MKGGWYFLILLVFAGCNSVVQRKSDSLPVVEYSFQKELSITSSPVFLVDSMDEGIQKILPKTFNTTYAQFQRQLELRHYKYYFWIRFGIRNNSDSIIRPYFEVGNNLDHIQMYFVSPGHPVILAKSGKLEGYDKSKPYVEQSFLSLPLALLPRQSGEIFLKIRQKTAEYSLDNIQISNKEFLYSSFSQHYEKTRYFSFFQILFMGFLLCQMLYSLLQWMIIRHKEYLYYFFYLFSLVAYFFSKRETVMGVDFFFSIHPIAGVYLDKALIIIPYFLYFRFIRYFLEMKRFYLALNKWFMRTEYFLLCYLALDLIFAGINFYSKVQAEIFTIVISMVFIASIIYIVYLFTLRKTLIYYVITGSLFVAIGNILGLIFTFLHDYEHVQFSFNDVIFFSQIGIVIEILCFTSGLGYKSKLNEREKVSSQARLINQLKTNEVLTSRVQNIRNKIARDLHDDIGTTLSTILMYSNSAKKRSANPNEGEMLSLINKIWSSASQMIDEMNDIVWAINPKNDDMEKIVNRMRLLALSLTTSSGIKLLFSKGDNIINTKIAMDKRKNCFLIYKEALNNALKYSECNEIKIFITNNNDLFKMTISDNGKGFDMHDHQEGNGLENMVQRAKEIGGNLLICPEMGKGTLVTLSFPLEKK